MYKTQEREVISTARERATHIVNILNKSGITLSDLKTMRMEDLIKIQGIGISSLTDIIVVKELMWKEELENEKDN